MVRQMTFISILVALVLFLGCQTGNDKNDKNSLEPEAGRYAIVQGESISSKGNKTPIIIKLNTTTGETWIFRNPENPRWEPFDVSNDPLGIRDNALLKK